MSSSLDVHFFRSGVKDRCIYEGASMDSGNNTMRGNLCAYVTGEDRVWTCSASDSMCWTFAQDCTGDDSQRSCSVNTSQWCCRSYEDCTDIPGQINVCWGPWDNPNENRSAADAVIFNQAYPVLPALSTTSSAAEATATGSSTAQVTAAGTSTAVPAATNSSAASDTSLSLGSIVGIGVGCGVAGIAITAGVAYLIFRRRKRIAPPGLPQQYDRSDGMGPQRVEMSNPMDRMVEIDNGTVKTWAELPANRN